MFKFSQLSLKNLSECHPDLQTIAQELLKEIDVIVIEGHRGQAEQDADFARGYSKLKWPHSKHNSTPAMAMDICPYPIDWNNLHRFYDMRERAQRIADRLGIKIRLISWDLDHIELHT